MSSPVEMCEACINGVFVDDLNNEIESLRAELDAINSQNPCSYEVYSRDTVEFSASYEQACHEHINCAIVDYDVDGADNWKVRPVYARPVPAIPDSYVLAPVEPTDEMTLAGKHTIKGSESIFEREIARCVYINMISASQKEIK